MNINRQEITLLQPLLANNSCHMNAVVILVDAEYIPNKYVHSDFKLNYSPTVNFGVGTFS